MTCPHNPFLHHGPYGRACPVHGHAAGLPAAGLHETGPSSIEMFNAIVGQITPIAAQYFQSESVRALNKRLENDHGKRLRLASERVAEALRWSQMLLERATNTTDEIRQAAHELMEGALAEYEEAAEPLPVPVPVLPAEPDEPPAPPAAPRAPAPGPIHAGPSPLGQEHRLGGLRPNGEAS